MDNNEYEFLSKILYPKEFNNDYIKTFKTFDFELKQLIEKSGYRDDFTVKYFKSMKFLINLKRNCIEQSKLFEKLKHVNEDLYSMRLKGKKNIRIIFIFKEVYNTEIIIFLNCFEEKEKKDYVKAISVAYDRIEIINKRWRKNYAK